MSMEQITLRVRFLCPAFLGDAHQSGAWRTPPFKAQLRQWWRVVMAARGHDVEAIRRRERELFGAADKDGSCQSRVRLRLSRWTRGELRTWAPAGGSRSLLVGRGGNTVPADLYLGYGPIKSGKEPALAGECAIDAGEEAALRIAWQPRFDDAGALREALGLMNRLGTVGGRSRNGWGSYRLEEAPDVDLAAYRVDWRDAVNEDPWPRGIGADERGLLLWRTREEPRWEGVIRALGQIRKDLCAEVPERRLLSYPVTKQSIPAWGGHARVPNSLRFKVVPGESGGLRGLVFHMPCRPEDRLWNALDPALRRRFPEVWRVAHGILDETLGLERVHP